MLPKRLELQGNQITKPIRHYIDEVEGKGSLTMKTQTTYNHSQTKSICGSQEHSIPSATHEVSRKDKLQAHEETIREGLNMNEVT